MAVTCNGVTLSQIHPVLEGRNRPLLAPSAFDINSSLQRCLVKASALHGLGRYIYAGEDLPQPVSSDAANDPVHHAPQPERPSLASDRPPVRRQDGRERINQAQQAQINKMAIEVGVSLDRVLSYFGVAEFKDIAASDFLRVVSSLEKRRKAA